MALGVSTLRETLPTNSQLNTRVLFITYQSKKLQLKCEGLAGLDKDFVKKVLEVSGPWFS